MKFGWKNDGGMEMHIDQEERQLIYDALRHYSAYAEEKHVVDRIPMICDLMNVIEPDKKKVEE